MPNQERKIKEIQQMLKLIPNNFPVVLEDLYEIYSQDEKKVQTQEVKIP